MNYFHKIIKNPIRNIYKVKTFDYNYNNLLAKFNFGIVNQSASLNYIEVYQKRKGLGSIILNLCTFKMPNFIKNKIYKI